MRHFPLISVLGALAATLASSMLAANDWPQWRGPLRDDLSTETGLLNKWPADGPPLAWKISGVGAGFSGVSLQGDRIFTMGDGAAECFIYALNRVDGKPLWTAKVGKPGGGGGHPGPRCTPTADGDRVYALGQEGDLVCVDAATGKEQWRKDLKSDFGGKMMSGWGYAESPLVDGNKVVCTPGGPSGAMIALDKKTGAVLWQAKDFTDAAAYASMIPVAIGGVRQYIQLTGDSVAGITADTGRLAWRAPRAGKTAVVPTPISHENLVYVTSGYGIGCNLFKITATGNEFKAEEVYANKNMVNHHGGVVLVGNHLYGYSDGKGWVCQELKTGNLAWSEKEKLEKGSLTYADGHLYLRGEKKGTVVLIEATPEGFKETGRFEQPERSDLNSWPHPVVAGGKLYLRDQNILFCYDIQSR